MFEAITYVIRTNGSAILAMLFIIAEALIFYIIGRVDSYIRMKNRFKYHLPEIWRNKLEEKDKKIKNLEDEIYKLSIKNQEKKEKIIELLREILQNI